MKRDPDALPKRGGWVGTSTLTRSGPTWPDLCCEATGPNSPVAPLASLPMTTDPVAPGNPENEDLIADAAEALAESRQRLAEVPAEVVVVNHVMGLYELAAIHLSAEPPRLFAAALAIDAVACLVEGLEGRLGEEQATLKMALDNIRIAFVQIKDATSS